MKADFEMQRGTLLLYPTRRDVWRMDAKPIGIVVTKLIQQIAEFEPVFVGMLPGTEETFFANGNSCVQIETMQYNDIWVRDSGAIPCENKLLKFGFNAWGGEEGLYSDWALDATVPEQMSRLLKEPLTTSPLIAEGGNLVCDGRGTLISIKNTLCNKNRNPQFDIEMIEVLLKRDLNVEKIIWIDEGLAYDETGGHIDNLCAFANEKTILLAWTDDTASPQYDIVRRAEAVLKNATNAWGEAFEIVRIPLPSCFERTQDDCVGLFSVTGSKARFVGEMIQPSYINFAFVNGGIILPSFDDPADELVKTLFERVFPDRRIVTIPAREILLGGGGIHCITKNF